jgi:branched-chain amino acid transport system ATP-binding protein
VNGISLEVGPGEAVGIIGANGAGKTSMLKAILGLAPRTARRVRFDGHDLLRTPARNVVRYGIGYVPEGRHVFSPLSVEKISCSASRPERDRRGTPAQQ